MFMFFRLVFKIESADLDKGHVKMLALETFAMVPDCIWFDSQNRSNLLRFKSFVDQAKDLKFACG